MADISTTTTYIILEYRASPTGNLASNDERIYIEASKVTDRVQNKNSFRFAIPLQDSTQVSTQNDSMSMFFNLRRIDEQVTASGFITKDSYYKYVTNAWVLQAVTLREVAWKLREFARMKDTIRVYWGESDTTLGAQGTPISQASAKGFCLLGFISDLSIDEDAQDNQNKFTVTDAGLVTSMNTSNEPVFTVTFTFLEGVTLNV